MLYMRDAGMVGDSNASTQALKPAMKMTLQRAPLIPNLGPWGISFKDLYHGKARANKTY